MVAKITFPRTDNREQIVIKKVTSVHIESGWKRLTDTATITIARNVPYFDKYKVKGLEMGFKYVESGPLVRSSYHAEKHLFEF